MYEFESLVDIILSYPAMLAIAVTGSLFCYWRIYLDRRTKLRLVDTLLFVEIGQYEPTTAKETAALHAYAAKKDKADIATRAMDSVVKAYGAPVRRGHIWWIRKQLDGEIAPGTLPPACIPGKGLATDPRSKDIPL